MVIIGAKSKYGELSKLIALTFSVKGCGDELNQAPQTLVCFQCQKD